MGIVSALLVLIKFLITIPATVLLLVHRQPVGHLARVVAETTVSRGDLAGLRIQLVADAAAALLVLFVATTLSVYKPRGLTPYGRRKQQEERRLPSEQDAVAETRWDLYVLLGIIGVVLLFIVVHLAGGGLHGH